MTNKSDPKHSKTKNVDHPGMMGDGTEEQNLNEPGNPSARIKKMKSRTRSATSPARRNNKADPQASPIASASPIKAGPLRPALSGGEMP